MLKFFFNKIQLAQLGTLFENFVHFALPSQIITMTLLFSGTFEVSCSVFMD